MSGRAAGIPPQPAPDPDSQGFWDATAAGRLAICRCQSCRTWLQPPLERCRRCEGETRFEPVSGEGTLYSFIVVRQPCCPGFLDNLPYLVGLIELDEQPGLRLPGRLAGADPDRVRVGDRVRAEIVDLPGGGFRVPVFRIGDESRTAGAPSGNSQATS